MYLNALFEFLIPENQLNCHFCLYNAYSKKKKINISVFMSYNILDY